MCSADVAAVLRRPVSALRGIVDPRTARHTLGLSLAQMGEALGAVHPNGHGGRAYSRFAVSHWEQGDYPMTADTREAYRRVLAQAVADATAGRVTIRAHLGPRVWRIEPQAACAACGRPFKLDRSNATRCPRCRRKP